ncbi:MAG TPA: PepSY domain-containing protein [Gammaproteobacteria bacterium]|nr:PepSY domain-containing protein [Gammaproteobacteria bacterium]
MRLLRRLLIVLHRYLGIPLSFLFVLWFVSGIAMIYVGGMPALSPQARLEHLAPIDFRAIRLTAAEAAGRAGGDGRGRATLLTVLDRPAYRFSAGPFGASTVFADTGETLDAVDQETTRTIAARFLDVPPAAVAFERAVEDVDQWTLVLRRELPLYKFDVDDGRGTEVYVSPSKAEVTLVTTARSRGLAWIATIPHWFYITSLRVNQPLWYWTVVWTSAAGCVLAALGIVLGVVQFRKSRPFNLSASIPYRGWMRWHYLFGAVFGVFALTWVFSGLLSMEPFDWTNAEGLDVPRDTFTGGPVELDHFPAVDAAAWAALLGGRVVKELELERIQDRPYYVARVAAAPAALDPKRERLHQPYDIGGRGESEMLLVAADTLAVQREPFSTESLVARLHAAVPDTAIVDHELLADYDSYYYSRERQAPLPVLRVRFDDPERTWVYVDPRMSQIVAVVHRWSRLERWLYNGLHSLDFGFWYDKRPLWDVGMIALCLGALASSGIGLWLGLKRLRRDLAGLVRPIRVRPRGQTGV